METKQLVEKFINGEITEEEFNTETDKLSPEEKIKLDEEAKAKLPDAVQKLIGVRRGISKISEKGNQDDSSLATKMRTENLTAAEQQIFNDLGIEKDEDKISFKDGFKKFDSGSVNVENIVKDMRAYYASTKSDEYFDLKKRQKKSEEEAEDYNAQNAGANGSSAGGAETKKPSKEVKDVMEQFRRMGRTVTPEFAQKALDGARNKGRVS